MDTFIYPGWSKGYINRDGARNSNRGMPEEGDKDRDRERTVLIQTEAAHSFNCILSYTLVGPMGT